MAFDHRATRRNWHLLVLRGESITADLPLHGVQHLERLTLRRQHFARRPVKGDAIPTQNGLVRIRDGGQAQYLPLVRLRQQKPREIIGVYALHDNNDGAGSLVIQSGQQDIFVPFVDLIAPGLGEGIVGL